MPDKENKLSIIYSAMDESLMALVKEKIRPLEARGALALWDYDFAIEDYDQATKREQAKRQLSESEQFIILWSIELMEYTNPNNNDSIPFQDHIKPLLQQKNSAAKYSIYSIIVRPYDEEGLDIYPTVTIPKHKVPLSAYYIPEKALESELIEIEIAIYRRLLSQRFPNVSKDKFTEGNLHRIAHYLIPKVIDDFRLPEQMLSSLLFGDIPQLLSQIEEKKINQELRRMIEQEEQEHKKQLGREKQKREKIFLSILEAKLLAQNGDEAAAEKRYQQAHRLAPKNLDILEDWQSLLKKKGDLVGANEINHKIDNATFLLEQDSIIAEYNGIFFLSNKKYKEADEWLIQALKIRKKLSDKFPYKYRFSYARSVFQLGVLYYDLAEFEEALNYFQDARTLRKAIWDQPVINGNVNETDKEKIIEEYAITLDRLGQLYAHPQNPNRNLQSAINTYKEAIGIRKYEMPQKDNTNIEEIIKLLRACAKLYQESGQANKAVELEKEALEYKQKELQGDAAPVQFSKRVFISYSSKDKNTVDKIYQHLRAKGIDPIIDAVDIRSGERIKSFISRSIQDTDFTLSVISKNSLRSAWVTQETIDSIYQEEKLKKKKFLSCFIDRSFFDDDFTEQAIQAIEGEIAEVEERIRKRQESNQLYDDLHDKLVLKKNLKNQLPVILQTLRSQRSTDLTEGKFEEGLKEIVRTIRES